VIRLAVRVASGQAELVLAELLELAPAGVEELQGPAGTVEYAVYGAPGELPNLPDVRALVGDALVEISTTEIPDDWHERWKQFHQPVRIPAPPPPPSVREPIPSLYVRPPWEAASTAARGAEREIVIDPGQAFGTGAHATTRLCLELLLELGATRQPPRGPLLDVGTGSGVLAIAAAALGFHPVVGLDHEQQSVDAARENALVNGVEIDVRRFDLRREALPSIGHTGTDPLPVVLANLLRPLLLELAASMSFSPAHLIAGGLLRAEVDEAARAFTDRLGLRELARRVSGEWAAVWLSAA
jgi:ribosomal protein L11 methyltransferase